MTDETVKKEEIDVEEVPELPIVGEFEEDLTDYKSEALKYKGMAERFKTKLVKIKETKPEIKPEAKPEVKEEPKLSLTDMYALNNAKVPEEDLPEVIEFSKFKGISIAEALKSSVVKTLLADKEEARKVANATNTGNSKRGSTQTSDQQLLDNASKGIAPESDEDITRLVKARIEAKKGKR